MNSNINNANNVCDTNLIETTKHTLDLTTKLYANNETINEIATSDTGKNVAYNKMENVPNNMTQNLMEFQNSKTDLTNFGVAISESLGVADRKPIKSEQAESDDSHLKVTKAGRKRVDRSDFLNNQGNQKHTIHDKLCIDILFTNMIKF